MKKNLIPRNFTVVCTLVCLAAFPVNAQSLLDGRFQSRGNAPTLFVADALSYSSGGQIVEAIGNVELKQSGRSVRADKMIFNRRTEEILASGNVVIEDSNGDLIHAKNIALNRTFSKGFISQVQLKLKPGVEIGANYAERSGGNRMTLYKGVLSPCPACEKNPEKSRPWQVKAGQIVMDEKSGNVFYKNVSFEIKGVPVLYLPFFSHADPSVERRTGVLTPRVLLDSKMGYGLETPYFVDLGTATTLKLTPSVFGGAFVSDDTNAGTNGFGGVTLRADFKQALPGGKLELNAHNTWEKSGTYFDENLFDANDRLSNSAVSVSLSSNLGRFARVKANGKFYTDRKYYDELGLGSSAYEDRNLSLESFWRRSYAALEGRDQYVTRDISEAYGETLPDTGRLLVDYQSEPLFADLRVNLKNEGKIIYREDGRDYARLSTQGLFTVPHTTDFGAKVSLIAGGFTTYYDFRDARLQANVPNTDIIEGTLEEVVDQHHTAAAVRVEWPFVSNKGRFGQLFEPVIQAVYAAKDTNTTAYIPNEDSLAIELDEGNMFNLWRTNGIDKLDPGSRIDYGFSHSLFLDEKPFLKVFVGQSLALDYEAGTWDADSGLEDEFSHIIGSVEMKGGDFAEASWRFRYDQEDGEFKRNDLDLKLSSKIATLTTAYTSVSTFNSTVPTETAGATLKFNPLSNLSLSAKYSENLTTANRTTYGGSITYTPVERLRLNAAYDYLEFTDRHTFSGKATYTHPCYSLTLGAKRSEDVNGDVTNAISFGFGLKLLGSVGLSSDDLEF